MRTAKVEIVHVMHNILKDKITCNMFSRNLTITRGKTLHQCLQDQGFRFQRLREHLVRQCIVET